MSSNDLQSTTFNLDSILNEMKKSITPRVVSSKSCQGSVVVRRFFADPRVRRPRIKISGELIKVTKYSVPKDVHKCSKKSLPSTSSCDRNAPLNPFPLGSKIFQREFEEMYEKIGQELEEEKRNKEMSSNEVRSEAKPSAKRRRYR